MISTPGHRASRRRQREALRAWCKLSGQLQATRLNPRTTLPRFGLMPRRAKAAALEHQLPFPQTMMVSRFDELAVAVNRWFESTSLQRRVHVSRDFALARQEAGFSRGCAGPAGAALSAETGIVR